MDIPTPHSRFLEFNLDPALAETVDTVPAEQVVEGILRLEDPHDIPPQFTVVSQFNRICTGRFAAGDAWTIRRHSNVISFKVARALGVSIDDENFDESFVPGDMELPRRSVAPFGGKGCIVAALDFGLDFGHPNFVNPDGTTRLVAFWHQGAPYDPAHPNRYGYGRMFSPEEINAALRTSDPYRALGYHPSISDTSNGSHGAHTMDIAAGNGRVGEAGAGYNADLIFVHLSTPRLGAVGDLGDSVRLLEGLDYVERIANGRPWVVNLSVGRTAGSHDGTSPVEQGMHELLRMGPGRAIVQSAGNYRSANLAVEGWLRDSEHRDLQWIIDPADTTDNEVDIWYSGKDRFIIAIRPPQGSAFVEVKLGDVADIVHEGVVIGRIYHRRNDPNNRDNHGEVFLYPGAPSGVWTVRLIGDYVISGRFHAWIERDLARPGAQSRFDARIASRLYTLGTIATSPLVITVGAYDATAPGNPVAPFSSRGPTRDERRDKPELLAPGVAVIAARSIPRDAVRQEGLVVPRSGTSMAAPHVAGVVAAMFEAAGRAVSIEEIRDCLKRSAEPLPHGEEADCWGRLDIAGAIGEIRGVQETTETVAEAVAEADVGGHRPPLQLEEQEIDSFLDEGAIMTTEIANGFLDRAEQALRNTTAGRRQSETLFLRQLMRELGDDGAAVPSSPADLYRCVLQNRPWMQKARGLLEVLALPSQQPRDSIRAGDWIVRASPGTGDVGHIAVLASDDLRTQSMLASEGIDAESVLPGEYGLVIEAGAYPHSRSRPYARRLLDRRGRVTANTVVLRPRYADVPPDEPAIAAEPTEPAEPDTFEESISIDDVAVEMNGLRCRFLSAHHSTKADGTARTFSDGAHLFIQNWNGNGTDATIDGFNVPKLVLEPAPETVTGMRQYVVALAAQRAAIERNTRQLVEWSAREGEYRKNHDTWEREKARLETLLRGRHETHSRMWVRQMMYNRFDVPIAFWAQHYNRELSPATALDANIVKSMLYQESRMGTSGAHLMPPPSDWSSGDRHPIRSRFNIGQAIDSWGPQQFVMMREMAPAIFTRYTLNTFDRTWMSMSNDDYSRSTDFIRAMREFFEFRDAGNRNLMGTVGHDLYEDYGFWIRTAIRWLFVKFEHLKSPTWTEAVRAYNGGGPRARAYRDAVMARVGDGNPFSAEAIEEDVASQTLQEDAPSLDTSAILTWEDLVKVNDSRGHPQVFYVVTGAPPGKAPVGYEGSALFHLRVQNTNSVYNHKNVVTKFRLLDVLPNRQFRVVVPWGKLKRRDDLEDESDHVYPLSLTNQMLRDAYNPDSPQTRLEVEYHWRETFESSQEHYNRTGLDFMLMAPIEYLFGSKQRLTERDIELNDAALYKADYWIPVGGVEFTQDIRDPVSIELDITSTVAGSATGQQTATAGQTRTTTRSSTVSNTFSLQLSGEISRGGSAKASVEVLEIGVEQMFKLGSTLGYSRTRTDTSTASVARDFTRSLMLSRTYSSSQAWSSHIALKVNPPEVPPPRGSSGRQSNVRTVGVGSVGVYLYPLVAFYEVPYVRFDNNINAMGQATRRTEGKVAVPFITSWRMKSHRGG